MKILGESSAGYIAEISERELANIIGYDSQYCYEYRRPKTGDELNVSAIYNQLTKFTIHKKQIEMMQARLNEIVSNLEPVKTFLDELTT